MDKLIFYAILMCIVALIVRFTYGNYCKRHFSECTYHFIWDKQTIKTNVWLCRMEFYWSSFSVLRDQEEMLGINLFFADETVNAARGIASSVNTAVNQFADKPLATAPTPDYQIVCSRNKEYMMTLIFQGARLSFLYVAFIITTNISQHALYFGIMAKIVPEHAVLFVQLVLIFLP